MVSNRRKGQAKPWALPALFLESVIVILSSSQCFCGWCRPAGMAMPKNLPVLGKYQKRNTCQLENCDEKDFVYSDPI
jgi:hypothetical protein